MNPDTCAQSRKLTEPRERKKPAEGGKEAECMNKLQSGGSWQINSRQIETKNTRDEDKRSYIYKIKLIKCLALIWRRTGIIIHSVTSGLCLQNTTMEKGKKKQVEDIDNEISLIA